MRSIRKTLGILTFALLISVGMSWQPVSAEGQSAQVITKRLISLKAEKGDKSLLTEETVIEEAGSLEFTGGLSMYFL
jgi:hypothetical protein